MLREKTIRLPAMMVRACQIPSFELPPFSIFDFAHLGMTGFEQQCLTSVKHLFCELWFRNECKSISRKLNILLAVIYAIMGPQG